MVSKCEKDSRLDDDEELVADEAWLKYSYESIVSATRFQYFLYFYFSFLSVFSLLFFQVIV